MPKVSVIIPTYNRAEFLKSAIISVLNQTYQDFEIIVVDDASPDATSDVVSSFKDPRIRYSRNELNRGEAKSRNAGLSKATGDYIAFLDDDDEWLPDKLQRQVDVLEKSSKEVGVVYTGFLNIKKESGQVVGEWIPQKRGDIYRDLATQNWVGTPSTVLVRRMCFDQVGSFDEDLVVGTDYDMWIRIAKEYSFDFIQDPLVKYHVHDVRLSTNHAKTIDGYEAQLRKHVEFFALDRKSHSLRYLELGIFYCRSGQAKKSWGAFLKAIRLYPYEVRHYYNLGLSLFGSKSFLRVAQLRAKYFHLSS